MKTRDVSEWLIMRLANQLPELFVEDICRVADTIRAIEDMLLTLDEMLGVEDE